MERSTRIRCVVVWFLHSIPKKWSLLSRSHTQTQTHRQAHTHNTQAGSSTNKHVHTGAHAHASTQRDNRAADKICYSRAGLNGWLLLQQYKQETHTRIKQEGKKRKRKRLHVPLCQLLSNDFSQSPDSSQHLPMSMHLSQHPLPQQSALPFL